MIATTSFALLVLLALVYVMAPLLSPRDGGSTAGGIPELSPRRCGHCGAPAQAGAAFCTHCGTALERS